MMQLKHLTCRRISMPSYSFTDLQLSFGKQTVEPLDYSKIEIRRGKLIMRRTDRA